jgi:cytoskeletal protein RodZ
LLLSYISLFLIFFSILIIVVGIVQMHDLPGKIAEKRGHPRLDAIKITAYLGLLVFPFWMVALIWAHFRPWKIAEVLDTSAHNENASTVISVESNKEDSQPKPSDKSTEISQKQK